MARRQHTPPYEIMRRVGAAPPPERSRAPRSSGPGLFGRLLGVFRPILALGAGLRGFASLGSAQRTLATPMVLRLPRGVVMLAGVVLLGLIAASFMLGREVADPVGDGVASQGETEETLEDGMIGPIVIDPQGLAPQEVPGGAIDLPTTDPRAVGLNYAVMQTYQRADQDAARDAQDFFASRGVATFLDKPNNGRFIQLVDVSEGFDRVDERAKSHLEALRRIGRAYKVHNNGLGSDMSGMYFDRYDGPRSSKP